MQTNQKIDGNVKSLFFVTFTESHVALFTASFETNPLDGKCDQKAEVYSQPVEVTYDAVSINTYTLTYCLHSFDYSFSRTT